MEKKELKFYEAPAVELVDMEVEGFLCASNVDNIDPEGDEEIDL